MFLGAYNTRAERGEGRGEEWEGVNLDRRREGLRGGRE